VRRLLFFFLASILGAQVCFAAPEIPTGLTLTPYETEIGVAWNANADGSTVGYYLHWGIEEDHLTTRLTVENSNAESYTITGLEPNTEYFVAISAFDASSVESGLSGIGSATTVSDETAPITPTGFAVADPRNDVKESTVDLRWNLDLEEEGVSYYSIYIASSSGNYYTAVQVASSFDGAHLDGLDSSKRYYFALSATDDSGNESSKSSELTVDTLPDTNPPHRPGNVEAVITGDGEITVTFDGNNPGMVDLDGYRLYATDMDSGRSSQVDLGAATKYVLSDLDIGTSYRFEVTSLDLWDNESAPSGSVLVTLERIETLLGDEEAFKSGCFIDSAGGPGLWIFGIAATVLAFLLPFYSLIRRQILRSLFGVFFVAIFLSVLVPHSWAEEKNAVGVKLGYLIPSDEKRKEIYEDDPYSITLFYERILSKYLSVDVNVGYMGQQGRLKTTSGAPTDLESKLRVFPIYGTVNFNFPVTPLIVPFAGLGLDYWFYSEKSDLGDTDAFDDDYGVAGYHGRAGIKLLTGEGSFYRRIGVVFEGLFSVIDRFGKNEIDLGGWSLQGGVFYTF